MSSAELFERIVEAIAQQEHLVIESDSTGTAEELLKRTDNGAQQGERLSWGSTGKANPKGYCQHATGLGDRHHLSHNNSNELTSSLG